MVDVVNWAAAGRGLLYFSIISIENDGEVTGAYWGTSSKPAREPSLCVLIPHLHRRSRVDDALASIAKGLETFPKFKEKIEVFVIDSSGRIAPADVPGAKFVANSGSNAIMRGLSLVQGAKQFTHCLIIEDGAEFEFESISRMMALFAYAQTSRVAVAACVLHEVEPFLQLERGARFDGRWSPLHHNRDLRSVSELMESERLDLVPNFPSRRFLGFALQGLGFQAFDYIDRGCSFPASLIRNLQIATLNGIAIWDNDHAPLPEAFAPHEAVAAM